MEKLVQELYHSGSAYENLQAGDPKDYDLLVVLDPKKVDSQVSRLSVGDELATNPGYYTLINNWTSEAFSAEKVRCRVLTII